MEVSCSSQLHPNFPLKNCLKEIQRSVLRRTAAEIAAAAVFEMFPQVELLGGRETTAGFSYDIYFPHPVHPDTLPLIEEKIRQIVRERRPIKTLEMVAFSASELLKSKGHLQRAAELEGVEGLLELIQIGSFCDLCPGPHLKNTAELGAFKLLSIESLEDKVIRIQGAAAFSKPDLKDFLKKLQVYEDQSHKRLGESAGFWTLVDGRIVWQAFGLKLKQAVTDFLKKSFFNGFEEISGSLSWDREALHREMAAKKGFPCHLAEIWTCLNEAWDPDLGLFQSEEETHVQTSSFCKTDQLRQGIISSLQTIGKTLNILGFNYCLNLIGRKRSEKGFLVLQEALKSLGKDGEAQIEPEKPSQIDFLIEDGVGRQWVAASLKPSLEAKVAYFSTTSVEKITALLIERYLLTMHSDELIAMLTDKQIEKPV